MNIFFEALTINVLDMAKMRDFWTAALGFEVQFTNEGFTLLKSPRSESNTKIGLQLTDKPKTGLNRMHLDLITSDGPAEVKRLEALGATRVIPWPYPSPDVHYVVMADPEGNEFCVSPVPPEEIELFNKVYQPY